MNNTTVAGNVARDMEVRYLPNGDAVGNFSVADNQGKDKQAIFWNCSLYGKRAETLSQYITKGQAVTVSGTVTEREWKDKEGNNRKTMEIRVNDVALQGGRREDAPARAQQRQQLSTQSGGGGGFDDEIPFAPFMGGAYGLAV